MTTQIPQTVNGRQVFRVVMSKPGSKRVFVFERYHANRAAAVESASEIATEEGLVVLGVYEGSLSFRLNEKNYRADAESLRVLRDVVESAKLANDGTAVLAMIALGLKTGRISAEV